MAELIWDGKYDKDGKRNAPLRVALPFQTVETVNESAQQRQMTLDLFSAGRDPEWRNRLIWGDKKYVLPSLLAEFAGQIDLIYIDPPFNVGADFSYQAEVGDEVFDKAPNMIETKAYRDTWGRGLDGYLHWFYETVVLLHELLNETGTIYVHLDYHVSFYAKAILDEVFGADRFVNEAVWKRQTAKGDVTQGAKHMGRIHESIFVYTKSEEYTWNVQYTPYDQSYVDDFYRHTDVHGRRYQLSDITAPGGAKASKGNPYYEFLGVTRYWRFSKEHMQELYEQGRIVQTRPGAIPRQKRYLDEMPGVPLQSLWLDIAPVQAQSAERLGYDTQKPEALLERIIKLSSNEGDLVLDCFCGSGTTAAVAEKLNRRWIACDLGRFAIHTTRKRLLGIESVRPFVVQNLGKYERQVWQKVEFGQRAEEVVRNYRRFILDLYHAEPVEGYVWLHGKKAGRMVHVGAVDSPVALGDVKQIAVEFRRAIGTGKDAPKVAGVDVLGWDFALDMNETAKQIAQEAGLDVKFMRIPREVLEQKAVEQGDIRFFELAALSVETEVKGRELTIKLTDFMVPPDDVPEDVIKAVKHWSEWIDYWAVDFNYRDDTFHNEWQSYRTRKDRSLKLDVRNKYDQPGTYMALVKVIDILGNDTTKALTVQIL